VIFICGMINSMDTQYPFETWWIHIRVRIFTRDLFTDGWIFTLPDPNSLSSLLKIELAIELWSNYQSRPFGDAPLCVFFLCTIVLHPRPHRISVRLFCFLRLNTVRLFCFLLGCRGLPSVWFFATAMVSQFYKKVSIDCCFMWLLQPHISITAQWAPARRDLCFCFCHDWWSLQRNIEVGCVDMCL
jgi:hypothetical protein